MSAITVREKPTAFNTFQYRLAAAKGAKPGAYLLSPGISDIASGGDAKEKIDDQRQLLTTGANTVVQYSENATIVYTLTLWTVDQLRAWDVMQEMYLAGRKKRPPAIYDHIDLRGTWIKRTVFEAMSFQKVVHGGGPWTRTLVLHEYNRVQSYGGPVKPGFLDNPITQTEASNAALQNQLANLKGQVNSIPKGKP